VSGAYFQVDNFEKYRTVIILHTIIAAVGVLHKSRKISLNRNYVHSFYRKFVFAIKILRADEYFVTNYATSDKIKQFLKT